jgi:hypothetical protein
MVDLFSGLGGASKAMRDRGWHVVTIDINPRFTPDIVADCRTIVLRDLEVDLLWASPPCNEFTRASLPWHRSDVSPDLSCVQAVARWCEALHPRWWVLENVRGAMPYLGSPRQRFGSFYLWGEFPLVLCQPLFKGTRSTGSYSKQERSGGRRRFPTPNSDTGRFHRSPALRAKIPFVLSMAVADAIERSRGPSRRSQFGEEVVKP